MRRTGWRSLLYVRSGGLFSFFFFFTDNSFDIAQKYLGKRNGNGFHYFMLRDAREASTVNPQHSYVYIIIRTRLTSK